MRKINTQHHVATGYFLFGNREALVAEGARINRRLLDLVNDSVIFDNDTANRAFETMYNDVRESLREKMFNVLTGEIVWTLASQLERGGYHIYKYEGGLMVHAGPYKLYVPSPTEPDYLSNATICMMAATVNIGNNVNVNYAN